MRFFKKNSKNPNGEQNYKTGKKPLYSYYSRTENRYDAKTRPVKNSWLANLPGILASLTIVFSIGYSLILSNNPKIKMIAPSSETYSYPGAETEYYLASKKILSKSIFNRSMITVNSKNVARQLQSQFPEIDSASISLHLFRRRPVFNLHVAPVLFSLTSQGNVYFVTDKGVALNFTKTIGRNMTNIIDELNFKVKAGQQILNEDEVNFINEIIQQLTVKKIIIEKIILPQVPEEVVLKIKDQKYIVKFSYRNNVKDEIGAFLAAREYFSGAAGGQQPSEYIDVRTPEKVFYK